MTRLRRLVLHEAGLNAHVLHLAERAKSKHRSNVRSIDHRPDAPMAQPNDHLGHSLAHSLTPELIGKRIIPMN